MRSLYERFGDCLLSQFDKGFTSIKVGDSVYVPDFYVSSRKTYVEVKSLWTVCTNTGGWVASVNKYKAAVAQGLRLKVYVATDKWTAILLPACWVAWTQKKLEAFIKQGLKENPMRLMKPKSVTKGTS